MAVPSKTVCLRAFNEDLDQTNPWDRQGPTPPPLPKRVAWPGGKIVSNKDEALASFLRRKLDQGQTLTPEQMAMLERMVKPNARVSTATATATTVGGKRKARGAANAGGGGVADTEARNLLHKLERKVARAPESFGAANGGGGSGGNFHELAKSKRGRRKVDLSSLKRSGREAAGGRGCAGGRRVLPDGRGGFTIATSVGGAGPRASQQQQAQRGANSKRPRGVGAGAGRIETTQAAAAAAAVAAIPGVYRGVGYSVNGKKNGRKGGGVAGVRGKKGPSQQQQQQEEGRVNVGAKTKGLSNGGAGGGRSLEELMSGGLAAVRR